MTGPARLLLVIVLLWGASSAGAASLFEGGAQRLGTKLTYEARSGGVAYRFTATVLKANPDVQFEWYTSSPVAADGVRTLRGEALRNGRRYCECYRDGEWAEEGETTSLWLSRAAYAALARGDAPLAFNDEDGIAVQERRLDVVRREPFALMIDGEASSLPALVVRADSGTLLWIRDDARDPLVLAVEGSWQFHLRSIWQRRDDEIGRLVPAAGRGVHIVERGSGLPVFLLHGGPGMESNYFRPYLEPLERDFRLVYVDQPGQGLSERLPPSQPYTMAGAVAAIEALRLALGYERIVLLGHSYGGFVAQLYALAHPERLAGLVLVDTAASWEWNNEANANIQRFGTPEQRRVPPGLSNDERIRRVFPLYFDPPDPVTANAFMDRLILSAEAWRQLIATPEFRAFDMRPAHARITAPTLVLVGDKDLITTANQARAIAAGIPNARLHVFPNTGHNPFVEEPAAFNAVVRDFLRGLR